MGAATAEKRADGLRQVRGTCAKCPAPGESRLLTAVSALQAMEGMVSKLDKTTLRPLQKESYLCMAKCCDTAPGPQELQEWCVQGWRLHPGRLSVRLGRLNDSLHSSVPLQLRCLLASRHQQQ